MQQRPQRWLIYLSLILLVVSCGEPVPVDCTPDEEQCTTETEGGFETGPVAGIAAGGAVVVAIAAGGLGGGESGDSSSSSQSGASNTNQNTPTLTGTLLDSAVGGVSYNTSSNLSGLTNTNGQFQYRSGDQVTFTVGETVLGEVKGGELITPVELAGTNNTADRRVINISRLLQSLDQDGDQTNGISISPATRSMLAQQAFKFDIPVTEFQLKVNPFIENILKRPMIPADEAINHLHVSLNSEGRPGSIGSQEDIRQLVPGFVAVTPANVPSNQPSNPTQFNCNFAGGTVPDGGSVIAYQSPNVAAGQLCSSQTRFCNNSLLSGSYAYMSCQVQEATDCQFNGNSIANGTSVTTYQSATVPFGQSCTSEQRFCTSGVLGGTYPFQSCSKAEPTSCAFNGSEVPHGGVVTAFLEDSVSNGSTCSSQVRNCFNGVLSGTYAHGSCAVKPAQSCSFAGQTIDDGQSVTAYLSNSVPFGSSCISETRSCGNGFLSGSHAFGSCAVAAAAYCDFNGQTVQSGDSITAYQSSTVSFGSTCVSENRFCSDENLSGSFSFSDCNVKAKTYWTQLVGTAEYDIGAGIASDSEGNLYVTGSTGGSIEENSHLGIRDLILIKFNQLGVQEWTRQIGTIHDDSGYDVSADTFGNVYVIGQTYGDLDGNINVGDADLFIVKYDFSGKKFWSHQIGTHEFDYGRSIDTDTDGNVYIAGYTTGELEGNISAGGNDFFIIKFNSRGSRLWIKQLGTLSSDVVHSVDIDNEGNIYVAGYTAGELESNISVGGDDFFIIKYDNQLTKQWVRQFGTLGTDVVFDMARDNDGNIYVTGFTDGSFDGHISAGDDDFFIIKYDSLGIKQWSQQYGTAGSDVAKSISIDATGDVYIAGHTEGDLDLGVDSGEDPYKLPDLFLVKYDKDGIRKWNQQFKTFLSYGSGEDIICDQNSNIFMTGYIYGDLDGKTNFGKSDLFVVKYNSDGVKQ